MILTQLQSNLRVLALLALMACSERRADTASVMTVTRDSVGITVVQNFEPSLQGLVSVGAEPRIVVDGHASDFHAKWIEAAVRLGDGRTVVLLGDPYLALLVGHDGNVVRRIGGTGGGPGEFRSARHLYANGDGTIGIWDTGYGPGYMFDTLGMVVSEHHVDYAWVMAATGDSMHSEYRIPVPGFGIIIGFRDGGDDDRLGLQSSPWRVVRQCSAFTALADGGALGATSWHNDFMSAVMYANGRRHSIVPLVHRKARIAVDNGRGLYHVADADSNVVETRDLAGKLLRVVRGPHQPVRLGKDFYDRSLELWRSQAAGDPQTLEMLGGGLRVFPDQRYFPPIIDLKVDVRGWLWVREGEFQWSVLDDHGVWLTTLDVPVRHIVEIGEDYLLGVVRDDDGVDSVVGFSLSRVRD